MTKEASSPAGEVAPETEIEDTETGAVENQEGLEAEPDPETGVEDGENGEDEGDQQEVEEVELNIGGDKIRFPKGAVPDEVVEKISTYSKGLEASYTKKFQEVSEQRKSVEARAEAVQKLGSMQGDLLKDFSRGQALRQEIEQLSQINIQALWQSNPDQARQVSDAISQKQAEFQAVLQKVSQSEQQFMAAQAAEVRRMDEEGKALLDRRIKGFSQKASEVVEYAVSKYGVDRKDAEQYGLNPVAAEAMYKAMLYDRMQEARNAKPKPKAVTAPVTPVAKGGTAKPSKSVKDMGTGELAKYLGLPG